MASVLPKVENLSEAKRVESLLVFRLDEGSIPSGSTYNTRSTRLQLSKQVDFVFNTAGLRAKRRPAN